MAGITVLSLFDGMSCGRLALERAGIKVNNYFASEIDKHAIRVTQHNFPDTIQLGDVTKVNIKTIYLSEAYSYICKKYFNNDLQNLQSIISERGFLHRIDEKQTFTACFGTQEQNEKQEVSRNSSLSINDEIWFFRNSMEGYSGIYEIIRCGERRKTSNFDVGELCEHSFWWNGYRQQESKIKKKGVKGIDREEVVRINKRETTSISDKSIFKSGGKKYSKTVSETATSRPCEKEELFGRNFKDRQESCEQEENGHGSQQKRSKVQDYERNLQDRHEINRISKSDRIQLSVYKKIQVTIIECEWGVILFKGSIKICQGGSPCQSFSFAGKMKGMITKCDIEILTLEQYLELKSEGYRFEGQSYLFWEYMRILNEVKPKYFLLENVIMSKKWEKVLSDAIGIRPIRINSALVSAQNRKRLYFTNIGAERCGLYDEMECMIPQPKDKGILLKDILEQDIPTKYYLTDKVIENLLKYNQRQIDNNRGFSAKFRNPDFVDKRDCLKIGGGGKDDLILVGCIKFGRTDEAKAIRKESMAKGVDYTPHAKKEITGLDFDKMNTLTTASNKDNLVMQLNQSTESNGCQPYQQNMVYDIDGISPALMAQMSCGTHAILVPEATKKGYTEIKPGECFDFENPKSETRRGRKMEDKSNCLMAKETDFMHYTDDFRIRRLTPTECERLQTVPDQYSSIVSDTQRYKMLGNGWTVSVISHIFSHLPKEFFESELPTHSKADEWAFAPSCKSKEE